MTKMNICVFEDIKVSCTSGSKKLENTDIENATINSTSGSVRFINPPMTSDKFKFDVKTLSGSVKIDGRGKGRRYNTAPETFEATIISDITSGLFYFN